MVNEGSYKVYIDKDGWIVKMFDGKFFVYYENIIIIIESLLEIIMLWGVSKDGFINRVDCFV